MNLYTRKFLQLLGLAWTGFILASLAIAQGFPIPDQAVLVERSFCSPDRWQKVSQIYAELYRKNQQKRLNLNPVILFNDLGEQVLDSTLTPEEFRTLTTFGRFNSSRLIELEKTYPHAKIIKCSL